MQFKEKTQTTNLLILSNSFFVSLWLIISEGSANQSFQIL